MFRVQLQIALVFMRMTSWRFLHIQNDRQEGDKYEFSDITAILILIFKLFRCKGEVRSSVFM
jgi:hypothetical protein